MSHHAGPKGRNILAKPRKHPSRSDIARAQERIRHFATKPRPASQKPEPKEAAQEVA